jgi:hypothetical protein
MTLSEAKPSRSSRPPLRSQPPPPRQHRSNGYRQTLSSQVMLSLNGSLPPRLAIAEQLLQPQEQGCE